MDANDDQGEWLQLTEEDLERARRLAQDQPPMAGVIKITAGDLAPPAGAREGTVAGETATAPNAAVAESESGRSATGEAAAPHAAPAITITLEDVTPVPPQPAGAAWLQEIERILFQLVNEARRQHLPGWLVTRTLRWHPELAAVARGHAHDMLRRHYVDHLSPEGTTAAQRISRHGIRYVACGENIGVVYGENSYSRQAAYDIHQAFMRQPRSLTNHRGNILNPIWTHVGIGVAFNPAGALVATQNFMSAPGARFRQD